VVNRRTLRLTVEYDGTEFAGWQQQGDLPTVQGALQAAVEALVRVPTRVRGASRTDAGVHARGQVAAFDVDDDRIPLVGFLRGLNTHLPPSVVVRAVDEAPLGWDPRRSSRGKMYAYRYWEGPVRSALERHRTWHVRGELDREAMARAGQALVGTHDFEAFRAAGCVAQHAVRTIYELRVEPGPHRRLDLWVVGNAFVRNMVRIIAGHLAEVGLGRRDPESVAEALAARESALRGAHRAGARAHPRRGRVRRSAPAAPRGRRRPG
jgi:tRNA pseudouridine38-40 synthase